MGLLLLNSHRLARTALLLRLLGPRTVRLHPVAAARMAQGLQVAAAAARTAQTQPPMACRLRASHSSNSARPSLLARKAPSAAVIDRPTRPAARGLHLITKHRRSNIKVRIS